MNSFKYYQGTGYGKINNFLREMSNESVINNNKDDPIVEHILNIDRGMKYNKLNNMLMFRGINSSLIKNLPSNVLVNKAYSSATPDFNIASNFTDDCCILSFIIPDDIKTYIYDYKNITSKNLKEQEVLLQRNTQFVNITQDKYNPNLYNAVLTKYKPPNVSQQMKEYNRVREQYMKQMIIDDDFSDLDDSDFE